MQANPQAAAATANPQASAEVQAIETGVLFTRIRRGIFVAIILLSGGVIGIAVHFSVLFPSSFHHSFDTYAIIAPAVTIIALIIILLRSTPSYDCITMFILVILWLTMGAWSTDVIGNTQCESLTGQQIPTKSGQTSSQGWCQQMKVIEAFSWAIFGILTICIIVVICLVVRLFSMGTQGVWGQSVAELDWFSNPYSRFANGMGMGGMGGGMGGMGGMGMGAGTGMAGAGMGNAGMMGANSMAQPVTAMSQNPGMGMGMAGAAGAVPSGGGGLQYVKQVPGHSVVINGNGVPGGAAINQVPSHTSGHHHGRRSRSSSRH